MPRPRTISLPSSRSMESHSNRLQRPARSLPMHTTGKKRPTFPPASNAMRCSRHDPMPRGRAVGTSRCFRWGVFSEIEPEADARLERRPILHRGGREVERCVTKRSSSLELSSASGNTFDADASPDGVEHSSGCELFGLVSGLLFDDACRSFRRNFCDKA